MAWQIVGHDWAVELLSRSLASGRIAHAYLFSGPPQIGKTALARALAQALNCLGEEPPCGQCPSCQKIARQVHPDVRQIVGEGAGGGIRIEQIRALQREAALAPYEGRVRVLILERMDQASLEAANSLLKTLEEPPPHVVLCLTAVQVEALPATIVSRCQRLELGPATTPAIEALLLARGSATPQAQLLARLARGRVGWAISAAEEEPLLRRRQQDLDRLWQILSVGRVERLLFATKASQNLSAARQLIEQWTGWWRDLWLVCARGESSIDSLVNIDRLGELRLVARQATPRQALAGLKALQTAAAQLEANVSPRLALESLLLQLPYWQIEPAAPEAPE